MEVLILHPKAKEEMAAMQKVAKALKIRFETQEDTALTEREKAI